MAILKVTYPDFTLNFICGCMQCNECFIFFIVFLTCDLFHSEEKIVVNELDFSRYTILFRFLRLHLECMLALVVQGHAASITCLVTYITAHRMKKLTVNFSRKIFFVNMSLSGFNPLVCYHVNLTSSIFISLSVPFPLLTHAANCTIVLVVSFRTLVFL